jgi:hypothetical protein
MFPIKSTCVLPWNPPFPWKSSKTRPISVRLGTRPPGTTWESAPTASNADAAWSLGVIKPLANFWLGKSSVNGGQWYFKKKCECQIFPCQVWFFSL